METVSINEVQKMLSAIYDALENGAINNKESKLFGNCADDFTKLFNIQLRLAKKTREMPHPMIATILHVAWAHMMELLEAGDYKSATIEAKQIRAEMKPILQQAREKLKT